MAFCLLFCWCLLKTQTHRKFVRQQRNSFAFPELAQYGGNQHESTLAPVSLMGNFSLRTSSLSLGSFLWLTSMPTNVAYGIVNGGKLIEWIWQDKNVCVYARQKPQNTETHIFDSLAPFEWRLRIYNIILLCRLMCGIFKHSFRFFSVSISAFPMKQTFFLIFRDDTVMWEKKTKKNFWYVDVVERKRILLCDCMISSNSRIKFKSHKLKSIHRWFDRISLLRDVEFNLTNRWEFINVFVESWRKFVEHEKNH